MPRASPIPSVVGVITSKKKTKAFLEFQKSFKGKMGLIKTKVSFILT